MEPSPSRILATHPLVVASLQLLISVGALVAEASQASALVAVPSSRSEPAQDAPTTDFDL